MAEASKWNRRTVVKAAGIGAMAAMTQPVAWVRGAESAKANGNIKQSVCRWCYGEAFRSRSWPRRRSGSAINRSSC